MGRDRCRAVGTARANGLHGGGGDQGSGWASETHAKAVDIRRGSAVGWACGWKWTGDCVANGR